MAYDWPCGRNPPGGARTSRRGWTLAVPDPRGAVALLRAAAANGNGSAKLFIGRAPDPTDIEVRVEPSIDELLADANLMDDNERAAEHLDRVLAKLLDDLNMKERELVKLPVLFRKFSPIIVPLKNSLGGTGNKGSVFRQNLVLNQLQAGSDPKTSLGAPKADAELPESYYAYSPNLANGVLLSSPPAGNGDAQPDWVFAYTKPDGPLIDGKDIFAQAAVKALGRVGVRPYEIDAWDWAHLGQGEVHCTSNVWRDVSTDAAWWQNRK
ncbi:hypothetical protein VZ94_21345 [Methylocucumis oryzae]|uniref:Protein-arginine deiminase C-terminal domain-containing protein n=1 Tax=Methylocucumis oryzae TaxID=1632867 RepID=A0A0F3IHQ1_9GAMM|nr:hypothetical protein VZ94_21345 [Methylocucumis oryzae]